MDRGNETTREHGDARTTRNELFQAVAAAGLSETLIRVTNAAMSGFCGVSIVAQ